MGTATITECDEKKRPLTDSLAVRLAVDFDPQSLELSYTVTGTTAAISTTEVGSKNKAPAQNTGQSATLALTLIFDTSTSDGVSVQTKTDQLVALTVPRRLNDTDPGTPRVACFQWGSFVFYGSVSSMTQTIDFFSDTGVPLRASVHLSMTQVALPPPNSSTGPSSSGAGLGMSFGAGVGISGSASFGASGTFGAGASLSGSLSMSGTPAAGSGIGTTPLTLSQAGDSIQGIAARAGGSVSWKAIAAANNVDNPRLLQPGTVLSVGATAQFSASSG